MENKEFIVYHRNGMIAYKMIDSENDKTEWYYDESGKTIKKCVYHNSSGNCMTYDVNGEITDAIENDFGTGKYGPECPCQ